MKSDTKEVIELIGILGVIASLIFVGMQLMLDRRVAMSEQYSNRSESLKSDLRTRLESDPYMIMQGKIWEEGYRPGWWTPDFENYYSNSGLDGTDIMSQIIQYRLQIIHWDNLHFQFNQGMLDDAFWANSQRVIRREIEDPLVRAVYIEGARSLRPVLDEWILELEND